MNHKRTLVPMLFACASALVGCGLRLWGLYAGVDSQGLPGAHISTPVFAVASIAAAAIALLLACRSPGRSTRYSVLSCGRFGFDLSVIAGGMIAVGACLEFSESLLSGPGMSAPVLCLLGVAGGLGGIISANLRRRGQKAYPYGELAVVLYLIFKLIFCFKEWSTDPIIMDYCVMLFALIFTLLAFHRGAGFVFDRGRPRATLFYAMAAVYFCAIAVLEGIVRGSVSTAVIYCGFLLWQPPVIFCLSAPSEKEPGESDPAAQGASDLRS